MEYKIESIKHTGTKGECGTDRMDGIYPMRIGRTVNLNPRLVLPGCSLVVNYLKDSDGSDYSGKILRTSLVIDVDFNDDTIIVETMNSIFEFVRVRQDDN